MVFSFFSTITKSIYFSATFYESNEHESHFYLFFIYFQLFVLPLRQCPQVSWGNFKTNLFRLEEILQFSTLPDEKNELYVIFNQLFCLFFMWNSYGQFSVTILFVSKWKFNFARRKKITQLNFPSRNLSDWIF